MSETLRFQQKARKGDDERAAGRACQKKQPALENPSLPTSV